MARVTGLGGIFFKCTDPDALRAWYARVLRLPIDPAFGGAMFPATGEGFSLWSPFAETTDYFSPGTAPFMVNFAVDDLDGLLDHIRSEGVEVLGTQEADYGRFAWIVDPAGVKIELWQPPAEG